MKFPIPAAIGLALAGALSSASAALSYDEALALAEQQSPALQAQQSALSGAEAARPAASALPDPRLSVGIDNLPVSGMDRGSLNRDFMTMQRIGLMQEMPNAAKRAARSETAVARAERERALLAFARLQLREALSRGWLALQFIGQRRVLLSEMLAENQRLQDTLPARIAGGSAQPGDLLLARQEALALADRRDELDADEARARAALRRLIGPRADEPLQGDAPVPAVSPELARAQLHQHAELSVYPALLAQARGELKEAQAESGGDWSWEVAYSRRGPQWGDMVSVQLSFDLPWQKDRRQQPLVRAKQQEAERVQAEEQDMRRRHAQELDERLAALAALDSQLQRLQTQGLPLSRDRVALAMAAYESGRADLGAVLAARRDLLDAQLRALDLDARRSDLRAQLAYLTS